MEASFEKLVGTRTLSSKVAKFFSPLFAYVVIREILDKKLGGRYSALLYSMGKSVGKSLCDSLIMQKKKNVISIFLEEIESLGFGKTQVRRLDLEKQICLLSNINNAIAKQNRRTFGPALPSDRFHAGLYSGCISTLANVDMEVQETECIGRKDRCCTFTASKKKKTEDGFNDIDSMICFSSLSMDKKQYIPNSLVEKVIRAKQLSLVDGELKLWGVYCNFFPIDVYGFAYNYLALKGTDIYPELFYTGCVQSKIAILFQINKFGIPNGVATFTSLMNQLEFFGVGKGQLTETKDKVVAKFSDSLCLIQHRKLFKTEFKSAYWEGILAGMARFAFEKEISSIETRSKGDDLIFEISFGNPDIILDAKSNISDAEIIGIIEEKMKHDYYLGDA